MPIDDLFDEEDAMISIATDIVASNNQSENPLFQHFSKLLQSYVKMNKQQKRIIRLSDKQHHKLSMVNREMKNILDNIPVGIAVISSDGVVNPSYSRYMHQLFQDTKKIAGAEIDRLLYWENGRESERNTLKKWLALAFNPAFDWDLVGGLGPDMIHHESQSGPLYFRNSFHRIVHDNGDIHLMIYITDITERVRQKKALQEQETAHNVELEIFSCVVNQETSTDIIDYINDTERMIEESLGVFNTLAQAEEKLPLYHHLFRLMHTIKGLSRTYGMNEFGRLAKTAEDILSKYRNGEITFESGTVDGVLASETLFGTLKNMEKLLNNGVRILHKLFNQSKENAAAIRSRRRGMKISEEQFQALQIHVNDLKNLIHSDPGHLEERIEIISEQMFQLSLQPLDVVFSRFHHIVKDVAEALDKKAALEIDGPSLRLGPDAHYLVINSIIHLIRNALDHGIEIPELRSELGKDPMGTIRIVTSKDGNRFRIVISDDGAGIDPQMIAEKALTKGFVTEEKLARMSDREKTELILLPGFSSRDDVSDISGQGVGMDVVAETMKSLDGTLTLLSILDQGTTLTLDFPACRRKP